MGSRATIVATLAGGLIAGSLDIVAAALMYRAPLDAVFRSVAAGWLGREAATGGWSAMLLGAASHYGISLAAAGAYVLAATRLPLLLARPWLCGPLFGLAVWAVMNWIVVPLSAVEQGKMSVTILIQSLLVHAFVFGLPIALAASRFSREKAA
jgi:hypothetical protein